MATNSMSSVESLPVEILHQIFDNLDAATIILSVRPVSRLFRSVINTYNRYVLDLKLISKSSFHLFCRLIYPQNIISIELSNDERTPDQITLFLSSVRFQDLTRLRSLTLLWISRCQLDFISKHIELDCLTSFSFSIGHDDDSSMKTTSNLFSSIFEKSNLRRLECDLYHDLLSNNSWVNNCTIQYLTINNSIPFENIYTILQHCPHLHTLIVRQTYYQTFANIISKSFQQLTSLTLEDCYATMDELESFLLMTPSLVHLKLINGKGMINGKRWEHFIEIHLPDLNRFKFFFEEYDRFERTLADLELIITSFRTPFWIEHKKWFVTCEYNSNRGFICIYSLPISKSSLEHRPQYTTTSLSTCCMMTQDDPVMMSNVEWLDLVLDQSLAHYIHEKKETAKSPRFSKVTKINIDIKKEWPLRSTQLLSTLIDFSRIVQLFWGGDRYEQRSQPSLIQFKIFLELAQNLSWLGVCSYSDVSSRIIDNLCPMIPRYVKHLQIPVRKLKQIKTIVERCEHLSTIELVCKNTKLSKEVIDWFTDNTINSACNRQHKMVFVWLGKRMTQSTETSHDRKRLKLTENHSSS